MTDIHMPARRPGISLKPGIILAVAAFCALLAGCGGAPYVDTRREAGQTMPVGASTPDRVAICYSDYGATPEELQKLAESECAKTGRTARFESSERMVCALLTPRRAYYACVPKGP